MRIERKGNIQRLTPRLERFFEEALGGVSLDDLQHPEARKADFQCLGGLMAIEMKSLEEDGSERLDNLTDELRERPDWPIFLGSAPMQSFLKHLEEPEEIKRRFVDRIGRAIRNHIRKANKQLAAHEEDFPRKNMVKLMVLVNEDHTVYDPEMVGYIVQHLLRRKLDGAPLYPHVDAVMFLTERHASSINQQVAFPILCVEGPSIGNALWKRDVTDIFVERWAKWNGIPLYHGDLSMQKFSTIEHIPEQMPRYEAWELAYRRDPYMCTFSDERLRERFDEAICISTLAFVKDSPIKPDKTAISWSMQSMSHLMLEMGQRGIPVSQFQYDSKRLAEAARRLGMSAIVVDWYESDLGRAA